MEKYYRASHKQLDFIASLCEQLGMTNPTLYDKYSMDKAAKLINKLLRKIARAKQVDRQQTLNLD